jgi:hypothetical protein
MLKLIKNSFTKIKDLAEHIPSMAEKLQKVTPKHHWLWHHAPAFLMRHHWWSLVSEQSIEHIHSKLNNLVFILFLSINFKLFPVAEISKSRRKAQNSAQIGRIPINAEWTTRFWPRRNNRNWRSMGRLP